MIGDRSLVMSEEKQPRRTPKIENGELKTEIGQTDQLHNGESCGRFVTVRDRGKAREYGGNKEKRRSRNPLGSVDK